MYLRNVALIISQKYILLKQMLRKYHYDYGGFISYVDTTSNVGTNSYIGVTSYVGATSYVGVTSYDGAISNCYRATAYQQDFAAVPSCCCWAQPVSDKDYDTQLRSNFAVSPKSILPVPPVLEEKRRKKGCAAL